MIFVFLPNMLKKLYVKLFSALLLAWYLMSIIGFDVHTCSRDGSSSIATFISGLTCADIHSEHSGCGDDHHCACEDEHDDCCKDDFKCLMITGVPSYDDYDFVDDFKPICHPFLSDFRSCQIYDLFNSYKSEDPVRYVSGLSLLEDIQSVLAVWRI